MAKLAGVQLNYVFLFPPSHAAESETIIFEESTNFYGRTPPHDDALRVDKI